MPVQLGHARETNVRVNPDAFLGAGGAERLQEPGIGRDTRGNLTGLQERRVSGLKNLPRLARRVQLDRVGRIHERLALHSRSEEHTSELQSRFELVCRLLLEKKKLVDQLTGNYSIYSL